MKQNFQKDENNTETVTLTCRGPLEVEGLDSGQYTQHRQQ